MKPATASSSETKAVTILSRSIVVPDKRTTRLNFTISISKPPMLSSNYIQTGILIDRPNLPSHALLPHFKQSLSRTLSLFPHLAGRLSVADGGYILSCNDNGAGFVFANAKSLFVAGLLDVPSVGKEFFSYDSTVRYERSDNPVLSVQVTDLIDGVFIGCSVSHVVSDVTSLWNFINTFAEMTVPPPPSPSPSPPSPPPPPSPSPSPSPPPPPPPPISSNSFFNVAPRQPQLLNNPAHEPHRMDKLSWVALVYCFTAGLEFNSIANAEESGAVTFRVFLLSVLLSIALQFLIAANGIFARAHPRVAFVMDRVGSAIVLISSIIAATPTVSVYVSIGFAVFMIIVYAYQFLRNM